jgi:hypothetical protein
VTLLDDEAVRPAPPAPASQASAPAASPEHAARPTSPGAPAMALAPPTAAPPVETAPRPPGARPLLAMRRGELPRAALPAGRWDDLDHAPRGTGPAPDRTTGLLDPAGRGRRSDQGVFEARIARDGSATLTDRPNLDVHLAVPMPRDLGRALARWYESDKGPHGAEGDPAMARQIQVSPGTTTAPPDPTHSQPTDHTRTVIAPLIAGGFDVSDWMMRNHGQDPYAHRKLALLDATRDERAELGRRQRSAELARAPQLVQRSLQAAWAQTQDLRARKQAVFELWDDCAETGDAEVVAAGQAARRLVIGFIRGHLPAGSPEAFTAAEIAALARTQHSRAAFRPYD